MNLINLIIFIILGLVFAGLTFVIIRQARIVHNLKMDIMGFQIIRDALTHELVNALNEIEKHNLENSDGFVKFLSDSRDAAFNYIENVQDVLSKFDKHMTKIIKWNETYGSTLGSNPHSDKIKEISMAYKQLKDLLPENTEIPNN